MGYLHIDNLYKNQTILLFKECFALEKIHGTSAHISFNPSAGTLGFFSGGEKHDRFVSLFDQEALLARFKERCSPEHLVVVFGEAYGGSCQGMSGTYGRDLKFVAFDVKVGDHWLDVVTASNLVQSLGLEFVHYDRVTTDLASLDAARDADSTQAIRNGMGESFMREGVVLRPLVELRLNDGSRVIAKHKRDEFRETATPRPVVDPAKLEKLMDAERIAAEWVTPMRLQHVLDKMPDHSIEQMGAIIKATVADVQREGAGEFEDSPAVRKALSARTASLYKQRLHEALH